MAIVYAHLFDTSDKSDKEVIEIKAEASHEICEAVVDKKLKRLKKFQLGPFEKGRPKYVFSALNFCDDHPVVEMVPATDE